MLVVRNRAAGVYIARLSAGPWGLICQEVGDIFHPQEVMLQSFRAKAVLHSVCLRSLSKITGTTGARGHFCRCMKGTKSGTRPEDKEVYQFFHERVDKGKSE